MIIRVRTQLGTWKVRDVGPELTLAELKARVESEHRTPLEGRHFTSQPGGSVQLPDHLTVSQAGLSNGDQLYLVVDEEQTGVHEEGTTGKVIKGGNIVAKVRRGEGRGIGHSSDLFCNLSRVGFLAILRAVRLSSRQVATKEHEDAVDTQRVYGLGCQVQVCAKGPRGCHVYQGELCVIVIPLS